MTKGVLFGIQILVIFGLAALRIFTQKLSLQFEADLNPVFRLGRIQGEGIKAIVKTWH